MNKIVKNFVILTVFFLIVPSLAQADIVYVKDDDRLYGSIQTPAFTIQTPYGKVRVNYSFLKSLEYKHASPGRWVVETINNDRYSGSLLEDNIRFRQEDGNQKIIKKEKIKRMQREFRGSSRQITTTIFTMQNGDRFSGKFLNSGLEMTMNYMTKSIQTPEMNRIEFLEDNPSNTIILLENGDLLEGRLKQHQFRLMPDAGYEMIVAKSSLKSIQFNAPKLVLKEFSGAFHSEKDSDGDGIPDFADLCTHTPLGVAVGQDGCAKKSMLAAVSDANETSRKSVEEVDAQKLLPFETKNILFEFNQSDLKPQFFQILDAVAARLEQNPNLNIEIHGHTDNIGSERYNQNLSENRARSVKNYFVSKGIKSERLIPEGFGFKIEEASNETEAGRALNRRVELVVQN